MMNPFSPADTATLAVTETTASVALPAGAGDQIMITSAPSGSLAFIRVGDSTVVATEANGTPILPTAAYIFTIDPNATHVAGIAATGNTATLYVTRGNGQ